MGEGTDELALVMPDNSERRRRQQELDIRVIMGNPPYAVAQHIEYPHLDGRIGATYAAGSTATLKNALYDSYIRAIRWGADRLGESGVLAYVSNGGWIDANTADGMRKCMADEFSSIYVFHLRGNARTSGEQRRKESGNIFGEGSRAPIVITLFIKNPNAENQGQIFYHDIGNYLSREEKLLIVKDFRSMRGITAKAGWQEIIPDDHGDWLRQRDDSTARFIAMGDKKAFGSALFQDYSAGIKTNRDIWCYNSSAKNLSGNIERSIDYFNDRATELEGHSDRQSAAYAIFDRADAAHNISWDRSLKADLVRGKRLSLSDGVITPSVYRPFFKEWLFFSRRMNNTIYQIPRIFPGAETKNRVISLSGTGGRAALSVLMVDSIPSLHVAAMDGSQCFPLTIYDAAEPPPIDDLFATSNHDHSDHRVSHGITDGGLKYFESAYQGEAITKDDIFYYTYGLLHSDEYRRRFADNLSKELPRIPCVKKAEDFWALVEAGRALGDLHIGYESVEPYPVTLKQGDLSLASIDDPVKFFRVEKMAYGKGKDRSVIHYNPNITLTGVPLEAYDYVVNGKSAIDWVMERQAVKQDKDSGIINDANDYANETIGDPRYPYDLLRRVITVSLETMKIVRSLPPLDI